MTKWHTTQRLLSSFNLDNSRFFSFTEVSLTAGALLLQDIKASHNLKNDMPIKVGTQLAL
jgi:hypothetical protein